MPPTAPNASTPPRVLVSACLLGHTVRYDGGHCANMHAILQRWLQAGQVIAVCSEVAAGLPVPRPPAEIVGEGGGKAVLEGRACVQDRLDTDVTAAFLAGAYQTLELARQHGAQVAVLKNGSPSCGTTRIYDGQFSGNLVDGLGVTAILLARHGIRVFGESDWAEADACLARLTGESR